MRRTPKPGAYIPTTVALLALGFGGLLVLMTSTDPMLGARWLFFLLVVMAFTGASRCPSAAWLNYRFPSDPPANANVVLRQALWVGIYAAVVAWLSYGRVINFGIAAIFLIGFTAIEIFLRLGERSQWRRP